MGRIKTVSFRSSLQIAGFQHVHVEACAEVGAKETPEKVMAGLKQFVATELKKARDGGVPEKPTPNAPFRRLLDEVR